MSRVKFDGDVETWRWTAFWIIALVNKLCQKEIDCEIFHVWTVRLSGCINELSRGKHPRLAKRWWTSHDNEGGWRFFFLFHYGRPEAFTPGTWLCSTTSHCLSERLFLLHSPDKRARTIPRALTEPRLLFTPCYYYTDWFSLSRLIATPGRIWKNSSTAYV